MIKISPFNKDQKEPSIRFKLMRWPFLPLSRFYILGFPRLLGFWFAWISQTLGSLMEGREGVWRVPDRISLGVRIP